MPQHPFPDSGPGGEEPDGSPLVPAAEVEGSEGDWEDWDGPAEQGLYVCLPAEQVTLTGFAQGGEADTMTPGPLLAAIVDTVTAPDGQGLAGCSDDQLLGIISAARRLASRAAWTELAAIAEYAARHGGSRPADEFAPVELGFELHLTPQSAAEQMHYASAVAQRLPQTFAALAAGRIYPVHVRIVEDETRVLTDADAAQADRILAEAAPGLTFGELRHAAHKLVLHLDPEAAKKRKEAARQEAHVRRFREDSGNAGMVARELPSDEVLASWQHVEQRALDLRAAGTLQELRVRAYLDLSAPRGCRRGLLILALGADLAALAACNWRTPRTPRRPASSVSRSVQHCSWAKRSSLASMYDRQGWGRSAPELLYPAAVRDDGRVARPDSDRSDRFDVTEIDNGKRLGSAQIAQFESRFQRRPVSLSPTSATPILGSGDAILRQ
jgi:hypothetical protein